MTTLHRARTWKIQVFGREHGVPHFHVWTPNGAAVIAGSVDDRALEEARSWVNRHRSHVMAEWRRLNPEKAQ